MQPLLQQLTGGRYRDIRLTPDESNGQQEEMDYRIRVWDSTAGRFVGKNLFSGGTRDQCSLALRLAFALATLPQELGIAPGLIRRGKTPSIHDSVGKFCSDIGTREPSHFLETSEGSGLALRA